MPKSRNRSRPHATSPRHRWQWRRAAGGWAEFLRNLALLFFGAPFAEPLLSGAPVVVENALYGTLIALALFVLATNWISKGETDMDALTLLYLLGLFVFIPAGAFVAFMAHRERLRDEADEADVAGRTAAE